MLYGILLLFFFLGCEEGAFNEPKQSYYFSSESHNFGYNCMQCHRKGGGAEGWFTVAGSVTDVSRARPKPNVTIELWTAPDTTAKRIKVIEVDALGNFYTTEPIDWGQGLYPAVVSNNQRIWMYTFTTNGACNACHNTNWVPPIWAP